MSAAASTPLSTALEVDGIPVLLGPSVDGRSAGGLVFRVGHADESLTTAGITHLVEHLALHFSDPTKLHSNGRTGPTLTHFHSSGTREEVVGFLSQVAAALRDLPLGRLATEKGVLRTEAQRRGGSADQLHAWRYGARDYGLASYPEHGLHRIGPEDVTAWARRWFTRDNAVLWLATDTVPEGLDLRLPSGTRMPTPPVRPWLPEAPAHYLGPDGAVAASALVGRSTAASVFASVLEQALYRELRSVGGYSYAPSASYDPLDHATATIYAFADALPENQDAVVGGLVDVLAHLRVGEIDPAEVAAAVENRRTMLRHPDAPTLRLPSDASDVLLGHASSSTEALLAELDAIDAAALRVVAEEVHGSLLLQVPRRPVDWAGYVAAPGHNEVASTGAPHPFIAHPEASLRLDHDAISVVSPEGTTGVRWQDAVAVQAYPDGARTIVGSDGFQVHVEPVLVAGGAGLVAAIDGRADPALVIPMPARHPDHLPSPPVPPTEERSKRSWRRRKDRDNR